LVRTGGIVDLSLDTDIAADEDLFGKVVSDLQSDVEIGEDGTVTGTLKYIADYTSAGFDMSRGNNFLVFHSESAAADSITVEVVDGYSGPVTLDESGIIVIQLSSNEQTVEVIAKKGASETKITLDLSEMTFLTE